MYTFTFIDMSNNKVIGTLKHKKGDTSSNVEHTGVFSGYKTEVVGKRKITVFEAGKKVASTDMSRLESDGTYTLTIYEGGNPDFLILSTIVGDENRRL